MNIKLLECDDNIADYLECVRDLNSSGPVETVESIKSSLTRRPSNILTFVMVSDDKKIVATATIIMEKKLRYQRLCCHIEDVGVHPSYRRKGYGAEMVGFCIKIAEKNNCYKIKLNCEKHLVPFYNKLGFDSHGCHMYIIGDNI